MRKIAVACAVLAAAASLPLGAASERIDYEAIAKIKQQGLNPANSQVMEIASWLTDVHGPRLTGSAATQKAGEWAAARLKEWGLLNVALEPWADKANQFAYGWTNDLQQNDAVAPIFREWMEPFRSIGMTSLTIRNTGGTDHQSFDGIGLPGFQFIQDEIEYDSLTHHTNLDSYERLQPTDMMRNATIAAAFAYLTANRDEKLPRKTFNAGPTVARGSGQ
jgi:hypothetical protein